MADLPLSCGAAKCLSHDFCDRCCGPQCGKTRRAFTCREAPQDVLATMSEARAVLSQASTRKMGSSAISIQGQTGSGSVLCSAQHAQMSPSSEILLVPVCHSRGSGPVNMGASFTSLQAPALVSYDGSGWTLLPRSMSDENPPIELQSQLEGTDGRAAQCAVIR